MQMLVLPVRLLCDFLYYFLFFFLYIIIFYMSACTNKGIHIICTLVQLYATQRKLFPVAVTFA